MSASHITPRATTKKASKEGTRTKPRLTILSGVGLIVFEDNRCARQVAERLAGKVGEQLVLFAQRMQEGLPAASVAIGLDVMAEFMEAGGHGGGRAERQAQRPSVGVPLRVGALRVTAEGTMAPLGMVDGSADLERPCR